MLLQIRDTPTIWHDLLRGGGSSYRLWIEQIHWRAAPFCLATILLGVGAYGASIGIWNGPLQAIYLAIKLPFVIFLTLGLNSLLNGILALLLGDRLSLRQTTIALLSAFSIFSLIVVALVPITFGMALDMPGPDSGVAGPTHRRLILAHVLIIAFAGIVSTSRLYDVLRDFSETKRAARRSLVALLAGNLFVGAQISFLLRPIFGSPGLKVEFLRPDLFAGNFYESVWWALQHAL